MKFFISEYSLNNLHTNCSHNKRILHLSDLHSAYKKLGVRESLLSAVREVKPSVIFLTGDLVNFDDTDIVVANSFVTELQNTAQTVFIKGNHEANWSKFDAFSLLAQDAGVKVLIDNYFDLDGFDRPIRVFGVDEPAFGYDYKNRKREIFSEKCKAFCPNMLTEGLNILLIHRPDQLSLYAEFGFDLVFAGHAHGGQIRLPFIGGIYAADQGFCPKYTKGEYKLGETTMYVNAGIGSSSRFPIRLFNPPEMVIVKYNCDYCQLFSDER